MTAQELWGDVAWGGWIALACWGAGAGLAGALWGRWIERRHQDERITIAVRLAKATNDPGTATGATLEELDKLGRALAHIEAEEYPPKPDTWEPAPCGGETTPTQAQGTEATGAYVDEAADIRIQHIGPSCTCTISPQEITDNGHLIGCPSRPAPRNLDEYIRAETDIPPSQKHTPPCICDAAENEQHHPHCLRYPPGGYPPFQGPHTHHA